MDHLKLVHENGMQALKNWMDEVILHPRAIPHVDMEDVDVSCTMFGRRFDAPVLVSAMTGGHPGTMPVNEALARACDRANIPLGLGSQRVGLDDPDLAGTYSVARDVSKDLFIIGNIGIGQLARSPDPGAVARACVEMIGANALAVHFNKLQELIQPEGDKRFGNIKQIIEEVARSAGVPVIAKEVGMGFSKADCEVLAGLPVACIDVGGLGGTNFALVEASRVETGLSGGKWTRNPGPVFKDCGTPTPVSVVFASTVTRHPVIATGGMRTGLDVVKALCLGASMAGFAYPLLLPIMTAIENGRDPVAPCTREIETIVAEIRTSMALLDAKNITALTARDVHLTPRLQRWVECF